MKKKGLKAVAMVGALALTMVAAVPKMASAEHLVPFTTNEWCNNTYGYYRHTGFVRSIEIPSHRRTDGKDCNRTRLVYIHKMTCASCGGTISSDYVWECMEDHSVCTDPVPLCD